MTSLRSLRLGEAWLEAFDADYDAAIGEWASEIAVALQRSGG